MANRTLNVTGMRCASCVNHVEKTLRAVDGVREVSVNLATQQAAVEAADEVSDAALIDAVQSAGYQATAAQRQTRGGQAEHDHAPSGASAGEADRWRWRLIACGVLAVCVVILAMGWPSVWSAWAQLLLAIPVQVVLGWPFYRGAWRGLKHLRADMDSLVALGTSVAFVYSVVVTILGGQVVYFDTAVAILVLIGVGKWMETRARGSAASAIGGLMKLQPAKATVVRDGEEIEVPVEEVRVGQELVVRPGGRVPVDGEVIEGRSAVDQSMVTGESAAVDVAAESSVYGGTVNQTGMIRLRATATGEGMLLGQVVAMVKQAQASKAHVQRTVDKVAGVFVPAVLLIALVAALGWGIFGGDWVFAMTTAVAVLIVACPCALGLATPTAIMVGTGLGAQRGILIKDAAAFERAGRLTHVVLDKTGTLTRGEPAVKAVRTVGGMSDDQLLHVAAAVETGSEHPLGRAIVAAAKARGLAAGRVLAFASITGGGVRGKVDGRDVMAARLSVLREGGVDVSEQVASAAAELEQQAQTAVGVAIDGQAVGVIGLADQVRQEAKEAIRGIESLGLKTVMMTGDNERTARQIAEAVGIEEVIAGVLPTDKQAKVKALQATGAVVAMVGDGINDAPALAAADVGIAIGGGTDIAMEAGHVVLVGRDLSNLPRAIRLSRATMRRIYLGLGWAFVYNVLLIPLAAAGVMNPMFAAGAMAFSSVSVVINALYLRWTWRG